MSLPDTPLSRVSDLFFLCHFLSDDEYEDEDEDEDFPILFLSYRLKIFRSAPLDLGTRASLPLQLHYTATPLATPTGAEAVES